MRPINLTTGDSPLILAMPHSGTYVPPEISERLNERGRALADTDWHIPRLYEGLVDNISIIRANFHRYVIDANRPPDGKSLYPGQNTTGLCPLIDFEGQPIYPAGQEPWDGDIEARRVSFHAPYHAAIKSEIQRVKSMHGFAVLYDCHSIRSELDFLFQGRLPDLNIGTFSGKSCNGELETAAVQSCASQSDYSHVLNGRFKGGWTTRHYGQPDHNVHAIQMELSQRTYMKEAPPWDYLPDQGDQIRPVLRQVLQNILETSNTLRS